ncbi:glycoside hydrolase family 88 protein [Arcicella aquatica]|uniref:Glycoside hydrolase family 88 protein n=1 Tax=Arcicella aquatica TaxID=217141 RepID=A0ABU5QK95_9BACT|nr:glycoside hydrolase family 88 protein [Arcicella aquatica]MEA5257488.1 glycoside hydrolase family 88 protein [Arcicella aquatica]
MQRKLFFTIPIVSKCSIILAGICLFFSMNTSFAQTKWSTRMADIMLDVHKDSITYKEEGKRARWDYEQAILLKAIERVWYRTGDAKYYRFILNNMDAYVNDKGEIKTYRYDNFNSDNITGGRSLVMLYRESGKEKFKLAADLLRKQLSEQPRTKEGGFWHKQIYPNQMWLDGLYMVEPFYAEYSKAFNQPQNFDDIANQFIWMEKNARDPKTGLLYHGYDESREQKWADKTTGVSPNFWGRSIGWYIMALADVLDTFPKDHPKRKELIAIYQRLAAAIVKYQDPKEGCWYQVVDKINGKGNYLEASGSSMMVYGLAKGARMGYIDKAYYQNAKKGYDGILRNFISTESNGINHLEKVVLVSGLGGNPYRDGSYEYYLKEPIRRDDLKGMAPFIMASVEMEIAEDLGVGAGKKVGLDNYFNHEMRTTREGITEPYHYTWYDGKDSGFTLWGSIFENYGAELRTVSTAPRAENLKDLDVYIIVDPDTKKETPNPNFVEAQDITAIENWVKAGGTLVLMANDSANVELPHFNKLAAKFGIQFTNKSINMVKNNVYEQGRVTIPANHPIFKDVSKVFVKELSVLSVKAPAKATISEGNDVIIAVAKVGKGTVFAIGDPWIYNEYLNGKRLPMEFENFKAAKNLSVWLLQKGNTKTQSKK